MLFSKSTFCKSDPFQRRQAMPVAIKHFCDFSVEEREVERGGRESSDLNRQGNAFLEARNSMMTLRSHPHQHYE